VAWRCNSKRTGSGRAKASGQQHLALTRPTMLAFDLSVGCSLGCEQGFVTVKRAVDIAWIILPPHFQWQRLQAPNSSKPPNRQTKKPCHPSVSGWTHSTPGCFQLWAITATNSPVWACRTAASLQSRMCCSHVNLSTVASVQVGGHGPRAPLLRGQTHALLALNSVEVERPSSCRSWVQSEPDSGSDKAQCTKCQILP
jgi:hypothetical protein